MLPHLNERMTKTLKLLSETNAYVTSSELAEKMGVTSRTIREDIKKLNYLLEEYEIRINSKKGFGYNINSSSPEKLKHFVKQFETADINLELNPVTPEDRVRYIVKKLLYSPKSIKLETFMDELFISESAVKKDLQKAKIILNKYNIRIVKSNNGISAEGHEINKRFCISDYLIYRTNIDESMILSLIGHSYQISNIDIKKIREIVLCYLNEEKMEISDEVLTKIVVHVGIAIGRIKSGQYIDSSFNNLNNLKNESEYSTSERIVRAIEEAYNLTFSEDEIAYITMHLVGNRISQRETDIPSNLSHYLGEDIYNLSLQIINEVSGWTNVINLEQDEQLIYSLGLHIKQLVNRLSFNMNIRNPLQNTVKIKYPLAFEAGVIAAGAIMKETSFRVNESEIGFLALHFGAAIEKQKLQPLKNKKKIALVCASGMATSELLLTKLSHVLDVNYYMIGAYALHQLDELLGQQPDVILTTIPIEKEFNIPVISMPSILNDTDIHNVKESLGNLESEYAIFSQFLKKDLFFPNLSIETKQDALTHMTDMMIQKGYINEEIKKSILAREEISSTAVGNMVAIPHPIEVEINYSCICTAILEHEIPWSPNENVSLIFIIVLAEEWRPKFQDIFTELYEIVYSSKNVINLSGQKKFQDFLDTIDSM